MTLDGADGVAGHAHKVELDGHSDKIGERGRREAADGRDADKPRSRRKLQHGQFRDYSRCHCFIASFQYNLQCKYISENLNKEKVPYDISVIEDCTYLNNYLPT